MNTTQANATTLLARLMLAAIFIQFVIEPLRRTT